MVIGVANAGGHIPPGWFGALLEALEAGLDLVSGMHMRLASLPGLQSAADKYNRKLFDVRTPPGGIPIASGLKRTGRRLLTVGTDCALGKKYTALAIARGLQARRVDATFRATGQTGIMIAGEGMPLDSVVADFIAGAAEALSPNAAPNHIDVIEGQGSIFIRRTRESRSACCTAASPIVSSCATSRAARTCSAIPNSRCPRSSRSSNRPSRSVASPIPPSAARNQPEHAKLDAARRSANSTASTSGCRLPVADPMRGGRRSSACSMPVSTAGSDTRARFSASCCRASPSRPWSSAAVRHGREIAEFFLPAGPGAASPRWRSPR
jgi:uncharacterized NAD-dependent epimerase/dehydratase family protein